MVSEGRQVRRGTVMIADVVNFYAQEPRSLEAIADVLDNLYETIGSTVRSHGGEIVKWMGDGALACFWGENHELSAIKVAIALQDDFRAFGRRHDFEQSGLTVSIATGEMIVGMFGAAGWQHYDVFGEPVVCTATIMPEASGEITICEATYSAVATLVDVEQLVEHKYFGRLFALKGHHIDQ